MPLGARSTGGVWAAPTGSLAKVASAQASNQPAGSEIGFLLLRHAVQPSIPRRFALYRAVGAQFARSWDRKRCGPQPLRCIEDEPIHLLRVFDRVSRHDAGAPRPADQVRFRNAAALQDVVDDRLWEAHGKPPRHPASSRKVWQTLA